MPRRRESKEKRESVEKKPQLPVPIEVGDIIAKKEEMLKKEAKINLDKILCHVGGALYIRISDILAYLSYFDGKYCKGAKTKELRKLLDAINEIEKTLEKSLVSIVLTPFVVGLAEEIEEILKEKAMDYIKQDQKEYLAYILLKVTKNLTIDSYDEFRNKLEEAGILGEVLERLKTVRGYIENLFKQLYGKHGILGKEYIEYIDYLMEFPKNLKRVIINECSS